ncbi:MAG TPA: translation initiation factor IF-3 [Burkholderiales bacterium]
MALERSQRINGEITAPQVRLVGEQGEQHGIVAVAEALRMAEEKNVDLVEIAPLAVPPVCKLMDYGKFRYREQKKAHEAKLKQKQIQVKEIKFRPGTDEGDYKIKLNKLIQFLEAGDKAKVTLRFRGREMAHQEFGVRLLERVKADLEQVGLVEQFPKLEGRQMVMVLAPKKKGVPPKAKPKEAKDAKEAKEAKPKKEASPKPAAAT